jgi:hypothetical protein
VIVELQGCVILALQGCVIVVLQDCVIVALQGCVIVALQGCVIVALQGCMIVALQGCVIVALHHRHLQVWCLQFDTEISISSMQWRTEKSPMRKIQFSDHARMNFSAEFTRRRKGVSTWLEQVNSVFPDLTNQQQHYNSDFCKVA